MEKSSYLTDLYLKNIMLNSGKEHDVVGSSLYRRAGTQPAGWTSVPQFLSVCIYAWRDELGNSGILSPL